MSRSNYDKPFYVDVGTSIVAIRCASNHDVIAEYDFGIHPPVLQLAKEICDRMNKEAEIDKPRRNCDVGTEEEQNERFLKFCTSMDCQRYCPLFKADSCELAWAQMPYEEGGAE